jgi:hypothetical protein
MFEKIVNMKLLKINYFMRILKERNLRKMLRTQKNFNLYFFKNFDECLKNVKDFVKKLHCFEVLKDVDLKLDKKVDYNLVRPAETTISVSEFLECLSKKFYEDYRNSNNDGFFANEDVDFLKFLFNVCCVHFKNNMLENNLMYFIRGKFNVDYFPNEFYNCFKESIKSTKRSISVILISSENVNTTLKVLIDFFDIHLLELQEKALNDLCESKLFFCHLLKYVEKNIKTSKNFIIIKN